jgi:hypothetical protein
VYPLIEKEKADKSKLGAYEALPPRAHPTASQKQKMPICGDKGTVVLCILLMKGRKPPKV